MHVSQVGDTNGTTLNIPSTWHAVQLLMMEVRVESHTPVLRHQVERPQDKGRVVFTVGQEYSPPRRLPATSAGTS